MKWNESGFRPLLCTYRLNWARRTSWGWWDECDDTVLQTQDSKFEPWRSEAEHATSRSRKLPTILTFTRGWGRNIFCFFETAETGNRAPNSGVKGSGSNHYPRAPARRAVKQLTMPALWTIISENVVAMTTGWWTWSVSVAPLNYRQFQAPRPRNQRRICTLLGQLYKCWPGIEPTLHSHLYPLGTRRCCDVYSTSMMLIQHRNNVVWPVG